MARRAAIALSALAIAAVTAPAYAQINDFTLVSIRGVGALDGNLDPRLGTTTNASEHVINRADCDSYAGGQVDITVRINPLPVGNYQYAAAYARPGATCATSDTNPSATDGCTVAAAQRDLTNTETTIRVDLDDLMTREGACDDTTQATGRFYFIIEEPQALTVAFETIEFDIDYRVPAAPELVSLTPGDQRFVARWDDPDQEDDTRYTVYWSERDFTGDERDSANAVADIRNDSASINDDDMANGTSYVVRVEAKDAADNTSDLSNAMTVTPVDTTDFWESYVAAGGTDPGGFCFIATAAWGSPMAGELGTLRAFRDGVLMRSGPGRAFITHYYRWGRFAAAWIADKPALRAAARVALTPVVWFAQLALWWSPLGALALLGVAMMLVARSRRALVAVVLRDVPTTQGGWR